MSKQITMSSMPAPPVLPREALRASERLLKAALAAESTCMQCYLRDDSGFGSLAHEGSRWQDLLAAAGA